MQEPGSRPLRAGAATAVVAIAVLALALPAGRSEAAADRGSENGRIAFVSSWAENLQAEVYRVDVASGRRTNLSRNPNADFGAVVSPDGRTVLFGSSRDNSVSIWAMNADGTGQRRLTAGEHPAWSPDGNSIAFTRGDEVMAMSADGTDVRRVANGQSPTWSPIGDELAWVDRASVFVGASDGSGATRVFATTFVYSPPVWSPDGTQIVVGTELLLASGGAFHGLVTVPAGGGEARPLVNVPLANPPSDIQPSWSPSGTEIAYVSEEQIRTVRLSDGAERRLTTPPENVFDRLPAWSPDGRLVAFVRGAGFPRQVFVVPATGGIARPVAHEDAHSWFSSQDRVQWTPDSRSLVYSNQIIDNDTDIYTVNPDGSARRRLTRGELEDYAPAFSPDGLSVVFVRSLPRGRQGDTNEELFVVRADGGNLRRLTHWPGEDLAPAWSPDGSEIVFVRRTAGKDPLLSLYTIRPDGTQLKRLRTPDAFYDGPSWSPDGRAIALTTGSGDEEGVGIPGALITVGADGRHPRSIVDLGEDVASLPDWSPDARTISFVRVTPCEYCDVTEVWTVRRDGSGEQRLVEWGSDAAWSPDGRQLVVLTNDLAIVSRAGVELRRLDAARGVGQPGLSWQPRCSRTGRSGADTMRAGTSPARVCGLAGDDRIFGGPGRDRLFGEDGNDSIEAVGGAFDVIGCGPGDDRVVADRGDLVGVDCEHVARR
jgi:TolB protein